MIVCHRVETSVRGERIAAAFLGADLVDLAEIVLAKKGTGCRVHAVSAAPIVEFEIRRNEILFRHFEMLNDSENVLVGNNRLERAATIGALLTVHDAERFLMKLQ